MSSVQWMAPSHPRVLVTPEPRGTSTGTQWPSLGSEMHNGVTPLQWTAAAWGHHLALAFVGNPPVPPTHGNPGGWPPTTHLPAGQNDWSVT